MTVPNLAGKTAKLSFLELLILLLSVYVLAALFAQTVFPLTPETDRLIDRFDFIICLVFVFEFFYRLYRAPSKWAFLKWGWIDLVASVPMFDILRWGRLVRVVRILRILRAFRSTRRIVNHLFRNRARGAFGAVALISITVVIFSSIAVLNFEAEEGANIRTPSDALWWSFSTIATVGYGDKYPVTTGGRIVGAVLMTAGVGLFGTFTGYVATSFLEVEQKKEGGEIHALAEEVRLLREQVELLAGAKKE